jgi:FixJ family two-component response regulator
MNEVSAIVHVVDDDAAWRQSVERLLVAAGYKAAVYDSAESFLDATLADAPGCILLDVRMPGLSGLQLQQRLTATTTRSLPIVFLSGHADIPLTVQAVKAGAQDLLTKPVASEVLLNAVAQAIARDLENRAGRATLDDQRARVRSLTPTERKVFDLVVRGRLNKQIGAELGITERTVKWHRHNFMPKLNVSTLAGLVSLAEQLGMIKPSDAPDSKSH